MADRDDSYFTLPELELGIYPATGATACTVKTIGYGRTQEMLFTGMKVSVSTLNEWGGVTKLVPVDELENVTKNFAKKIARQNAEILQLINHSLKSMMVLPSNQWQDIEDKMARYYFQKLFNVETMPLKDFLLKSKDR